MRRFFLATLCTLALGTAVQAATVFDRFTSFYVTGDSLSDHGKLIGAFEAPSVGNRFSNGPVWVEVIADHFAVDFNFALGGATAGPSNTTLYPEPLAPLATFGGQAQVLGGAAALSGDNPLVSVLFGANDIFQGLQAGTITPTAVRGFAKSVAEGIVAVQTNGGAQFDDFMVANLPDLGRIPAFNLPVLQAAGELQALTLGGASADDIAEAQSKLATAQQAQVTASALTGIFNVALVEELDAISNRASIYLIDQFSYFNALLDNPSRLGLVSGDIPCTLSLRAAPTAGDCIVLGFDTEGNPIINQDLADLFLFIDPVHPNRVAQADFAAFAIAELGRQVTPVPLPAGLPLLLACLGVLAGGAARQRRRAA